MAEQKTKGKKSKTKRQKNLARGNAIAGYLFISPLIIGFLLFLAYPLAQSFYMSFCKVSPVAGQGFEFVWSGLTHYKHIFTVDPDYTRLLLAELQKMALYVPSILIFSFFMSLLLNQEFKGRTFVRAVYFLPVILSSGVMVGLETNNSLLSGMQDLIKEDTNGTSITATLESILLQGENGNSFFELIIRVVDEVYNIAISSGIQIIIFLSGLQTISPSMYEAAKIEGCTGWESFWKITFPMISSLILVNIIYTIVDFFTKSDSEFMEMINETLLQDFNYGRVSAMSWVYFAIIIVILGIVSLIISKRVYYYD